MTSIKTAARLAMKDISNYLKTNEFKIVDECFDVWVVTPTFMDTKETRLLNKKLGLRNINNFGNKNGLTIK